MMCMAFIIYRKISRLFDKTYYHLFHLSDDTSNKCQIDRFVSILNLNAEKTIDALINVDGIAAIFELEDVKNATDIYIENVRHNLTTNRYMEININEHIHEISQITCRVLNQTAFQNGYPIRFTFDMKDDNGSFNLSTIRYYLTFHRDHYIYEINSNINLVNYDYGFLLFLEGVYNTYDTTIVTTAIIDGHSRKYIMLPDKNVLSNAIGHYYGIKLF